MLELAHDSDSSWGGAIMPESLKQASVNEACYLFALHLIAQGIQCVECDHDEPRSQCRDGYKRKSCALCRLRNLCWLEREGGDVAQGAMFPDDQWFGRLAELRGRVLGDIRRLYGPIGVWLSELLLEDVAVPVRCLCEWGAKVGYRWEAIAATVDAMKLPFRWDEGARWVTLAPAVEYERQQPLYNRAVRGKGGS